MTLQQTQLISRAREARAAGRLTEARNLARQAHDADRKDIAAIEILGEIAVDLGEIDEALRRFRKCVTLRPKEPRYVFQLGRALFESGRAAEALSKYEKVLRVKPDATPVLLSKSVALERIGRNDEAYDTLAPAIAAGDASPAMIAEMARIEMGRGRVAEAIDVLRATLDGGTLETRQRPPLLYALGKAYDKAGDYDAAFAACREANAIEAVPFDRGAYATQVDRLIAMYASDRLASLARSPARTDLPVLMAGLPRSGTTLIEQIVDAHPRGGGAGEISHLTRLAPELQMTIGSYEPYPACLEDLEPPLAQRLGRDYLARLRGVTRGATRVVDKTLDNTLLLGLAWQIVPGARVVVAKRDPRDACLSCYLSHLLPQRFGWVTDLENLAFACGEHDRMLAHWRDTLDMPMLDVVYEELIADQETHTRRLVEFLDLPWDDKCLRSHESGRTVMTLSYDQVSQPIYDRSVGRWRNYEKHLGPLLAAL